MQARRRDYSLTGPDSQRAVELGLAQAQWYRSPVDRKRMKQLMQRRNGPAIRDTVIWLGAMVVLAGLGVWLWFSVWSLVCFAVYGVLYGSASDSRWHECSHGTAFRTDWMNRVVYQIACFMIMRDPTVWRWSHIRHHTDTIVVGRDPEILATRPPKLWRIAINFFGLIDVPRAFRHMFRHASGRLTPDEQTFIPESEWAKTFWTARVWLSIYAAVITWCVASRSVLPAMVIGLPRIYGCWHHVLTGLIQHAGLAEDVTDHRLNSRTCRMNRVSRFVYWNMNYHVEHHMFPMVPFHALPGLHTEIRDDLPPIVPNMWTAYREFVPVLWRQRSDPDFYIRRDVGRARPDDASMTATR